MKQFSLEEFKKNPNRKVVTRDGRSVRIICTDAKIYYPVIALIEEEGVEHVFSYLPDGTFGCISGSGRYDLFFDTEKKEGWVNIYKLNEHYMRAGDLVFQTKEEAMKSISSEDYVATTHIEWEE